MIIKKILESMPSPKKEQDSLDWQEHERKLGIDFPLAYKEFLANYGTGEINEFLWILNPFCDNSNLNIEKALYFQDAYNEMKELFGEDYSRPKFPEKDSFLTWAVSDNGDSFFWVVNNDVSSDEWQVGVHSSDQGEEELTNCNTLSFLEKIAASEFKSNILPAQFLEADKVFKALKA